MEETTLTEKFFEPDILRFLFDDYEETSTTSTTTSTTFDQDTPAPIDDHYPANEGEEVVTVQELEQPAAKRVKTTKRVFAPPKSAIEIEQAKRAAIHPKTVADMKYCLHIWEEWATFRLTEHRVLVPPIHELQELNF